MAIMIGIRRKTLFLSTFRPLIFNAKHAAPKSDNEITIGSIVNAPEANSSMKYPKKVIG
jgi:hypothetical protein